MDLSALMNIQPFSPGKQQKEELLNAHLSELTRHHYHSCIPYQKILDSTGFDPHADHDFQEIPFLPASLFKMVPLISIPERTISKTLTSSGTSGFGRSQIFLDRQTSTNQTRALVKIVQSFIGKKRMPMLIIDNEVKINKSDTFSAGTAGILGFSLFGSERLFLLDENDEPDIEKLNEFIEKHGSEPFLIFGFTFNIYSILLQMLSEKAFKPDFSNAILIHGGGWKRLEKESVSKEEFKKRLRRIYGLKRTIDYYGMAEQTGSVFMECECGYLHASIFSDILIRRTVDFSPEDHGKEGIIQVLSLLPESYPGHSVLTEDKGIILGEDNCRCGRLGKYFIVTGRINHAEIKGCSDVYERY